MFHSKQWHYSLHRDFQNCYSTRRSLTRFFKAPIPAPTLHVHITENFSIQNPILHTEDRELFEYHNSTHRRQGDLLEMHPCVLQDIPGNSSCSRDIPDIPVIHDLPAFPGNSTMFQYLQGIHPIPAFLRLECIFYNSTVRLVSTENSTEYQLGNYRHYKHSFILQRKGDVAISVKRASVKMSR